MVVDTVATVGMVEITIMAEAIMDTIMVVDGEVIIMAAPGTAMVAQGTTLDQAIMMTHQLYV